MCSSDLVLVVPATKREAKSDDPLKNTILFATRVPNGLGSLAHSRSQVRSGGWPSVFVRERGRRRPLTSSCG